MPNQLAHIRFAQKVLEAVSPAVRTRICPDSMAFRCGTLGPDPLFNDLLPGGHSQGLGLHNSPGRVALERMRGPVHDDMPWAADYAAGFFTHYALDRLSHPELLDMERRGETVHAAVETAYDRVLLARCRDDMPAQLKVSPSELRAAAAAFNGISPKRYRADLSIYWFIQRFLLSGKSSCLAFIPKMVYSEWDGLIPYSKPSPGVMRGMEVLEARIAASVDITAEQLDRYFAAIDANLPLDPWTDADFTGTFPEIK